MLCFSPFYPSWPCMFKYSYFCHWRKTLLFLSKCSIMLNGLETVSKWTEPNWTKGSRQQLTSHEQRWMGTHNIQNISSAYKKNPLSPTKFWEEEISKFIKDLITIIKLLSLEKFYFKTNNIFERKYKYVHSISILNILLKQFLNVIITALRLIGFFPVHPRHYGSSSVNSCGTEIPKISTFFSNSMSSLWSHGLWHRMVC